MELEQLLALIPEGDQYSDVRDSLTLIAKLFPEQLAEIDAARVRGWVADIDQGKRTEDVIRSDIFEFIVGSEEIQRVTGASAEEAEALISGEETFAKFQPAAPGTVTIGDTTIPEGARLVRVRNPEGSDAPELYYLVYQWRGVELAYEVGDRARFDELFGDVAAFDSYQTFDQAGFDAEGFVAAGSADQQLGATESVASQIEREIRELGLEDLPAWLAGDEEALALVAESTAQGWSSGRLWTELSETQGFQDRFGDVLELYTEGGTPIGTAVDQIIADEQSLRAAIRRFRPEGFEVSNEYLHEAMGQGWTATSAAAVLEVAEDMRRNPDGLVLTNQILAASGLETLDEVGFMNVLAGAGAPDVMEALNTAQAGRALAEAGLEDVDVDLLLEVVDTSDRLVTADSYRDLAQQLAFNMIRNSRELDVGKFGLSEDDLVAAAFGRESPRGKSSGEVLNLLARFERDRRAAAQGTGGVTAFQDQEGQLRVAGLSGL